MLLSSNAPQSSRSAELTEYRIERAGDAACPSYRAALASPLRKENVTMISVPSRARVAALAAAFVTAAVLIPQSAASASVQPSVKLNGDWAPFNRCPVTNTAMLQTDGVNQTPLCVASSSPSGTIKIGNMTPTTSTSDLQFGLVSSSAGFTVIAPRQGAVQSAPVSQPGGLSGMICPSSKPPVRQLCKTLARNSKLNKVTATLMSAGAPSNFNLGAGLSSGVAIVTLPVKIHLQNSFLGPKCYVGTNANPIVLHPENATNPVVNSETFDGNGTPDPSGVMFAIFSNGGTQQDTSFSVPAVTGCGSSVRLDAPIDQNGGLPSPSGQNSLVLTDASAYLAGLGNASTVAPNAGVTLSNYWHSAIIK
jgi:hypothetical protein